MFEAWEHSTSHDRAGSRPRARAGHAYAPGGARRAPRRRAGGRGRCRPEGVHSDRPAVSGLHPERAGRCRPDAAVRGHRARARRRAPLLHGRGDVDAASAWTLPSRPSRAGPPMRCSRPKRGPQASRSWSSTATTTTRSTCCLHWRRSRCRAWWPSAGRACSPTGRSRPNASSGLRCSIWTASGCAASSRSPTRWTGPASIAAIT